MFGASAWRRFWRFRHDIISTAAAIAATNAQAAASPAKAPVLMPPELPPLLDLALVDMPVD